MSAPTLTRRELKAIGGVVRPYSDQRMQGRFDVNGVEWWACDPYPTWFRWEGDVLRTDPADWADAAPRPKPCGTGCRLTSWSSYCPCQGWVL